MEKLQSREVSTKEQLEVAKNKYIENVIAISAATEALAKTPGHSGEGVSLHHFTVPEDLALYIYPKNDSDAFAYTSESGLERPRIVAINRLNPLAVGNITSVISADGGTRFFFMSKEDESLVFSLVLPERLNDFAVTTTLPEANNY